jgi:hypothetical protein
MEAAAATANVVTSSNALAGHHQGGSVLREANGVDQFYNPGTMMGYQGVPNDRAPPVPGASHFMPSFAVHAARATFGP